LLAVFWVISGHSFSEPDVIKDKLESGVWYVLPCYFDDYCVGIDPFDPKSLVARVRNVLDHRLAVETFIYFIDIHIDETDE